MRRLVVEADGGSRGNPGPAAYGTVVRDAATGEVLTERAEYLGVATNNVAEYRGLIAGLEAAAAIDPQGMVEARLDSKLVVEQMSGRWKIKHQDMRPLALRAREVFAPERVTYVWVPRELNSHADRLANEAMDAGARGEPWSAGSSSSATPTAAVVDEAEVEPPPVNVLRGWSVETEPPTTFLMLRHGETAHTVEKRFSGMGGLDPGLTEVGRQQARRAGGALRQRDLDGVACSPLARARETAEVVANELGLPVRVVDGLAECAFGEWEGLTFAEVQERWPSELAAWLGSTTVAPPGGESFDDVERRLRTTRDKLIARHARRDVLLVTHVTPIKILVRLALGAPAESLFRMELWPASLTEIAWYADGHGSMRLFNGASHLDIDPA